MHVHRTNDLIIPGDMIAHPELPESLIGRSVEVLHTMSPNERDLIRLVVEVISELRDKVMDEDAVVSWSSPLLTSKSDIIS